MSRFNPDVYDKLFPRQKEVEKVETVVETFTPSVEERNDTPETVIEEVVNDGQLEDNNGLDN